MSATADPFSIRATRYIPESTLEGLNDKQLAALWCDDEELFYGGAAGGGKSEMLLAGALQYVDVPDYAAILFRRSYTDLALPGALMDRAHQWLDETDARWHRDDKTWTFPSGASVTFGYLKHEADKHRYQSAEFQYVGFDELTEFPETDYLYLFSRLRGPSTGPLSRVPLRMRSASNPGGVGHAWVKARFVDPGSPDRIFIPARLDDNPHINQEAYRKNLRQLDAQTAKQLEEGDWSVRPPGDWYFDHLDIVAASQYAEDQLDVWLARREPIPPVGGSVQVCIDWGETSQAYTVWPLEGGGIYIPPSEVFAERSEPGETTRNILTHCTRFGYPVDEARYDAAGVQSMRTFAKIARTQGGLPRLRTVKVPFGKPVSGTGRSYKAETSLFMRRLFERVGNGKTVQIIAISPENRELLRQLPELPSDPETNGSWKKMPDQHGPDALVAGIAPVAARHRQLIQTEYERMQRDQKLRDLEGQLR